MQQWRFGHDVTVTSRDAQRAATAAEAIGCTGSAAIDPSRPDQMAALGTPGIVVDCTGLESIEVTRALLEQGWKVVDITADGRHTRALLDLDPADSTLLLGVGLMPGLSSILAANLLQTSPHARSLTISALVGLGDDYGDASKRWTYSQIGSSLPDQPGTRGFTDGRNIDFPGGFGRRRAWQVDFADRVLLRQRYGVDVKTRYCFDSRSAGAALALPAKIPGLPKLLTRHPDLTRPPKRSTDWYAFVAQTDTGQRISGLGRSQAASTAAMVALATDRFARSSMKGTLATLDLVEIDDITSNPALGILIGD
jgi:hypothetical protein